MKRDDDVTALAVYGGDRIPEQDGAREMASTQDDGKDGKDVAAHRTFTDTDEPQPREGSKPRYPKLDDEDDTEGHLYGAGPSTQGEAFPHPSDNPHGDR